MNNKTYLEHLTPRIEVWKHDAKPEDIFMSINNSSWHMSIFPRFHRNIEEIHNQMREEKEESMSYSTTSCVWDLKQNIALYVYHEFNNLRESTDKEKEDFIKSKLEKIKKEEELKARTRKIEEVIHSRNEEFIKTENEYKNYIEECVAFGINPVDYITYKTSKLNVS